MIDDDLLLLQKTHSGLGKLLKRERPSPDEDVAIDMVVKMLATPPPRRADPVMVELAAKFRDGSVEEQREVQTLIVEMGRIAREEQQSARRPSFKLGKRRSNAVGGGSFFR
jgi:hypothetical protein